jgi:hypothetical protein
MLAKTFKEIYMQTNKLFHNSFYLLLAFLLLAGVSCKKRDVSELEAPTFPVRAEVFIDDFTPDLTYDAFGGSDVKAFDIDRKETYNGTAASMRFAVPDENSPQGAYAGGTFKSRSGRDLSGFNALTFYIKASQAVNIGVVGFGNDLGENKYVASKFGLAVNSNWKKVILPIPDASKLKGERGMFYFSSGAVNGKGYTVWIDEVKFENLSTLGTINGVILNGADRVVTNAENGDKLTVDGLFATANLPNGVNETVSAAVSYFNFASSATSVATVDAAGVVSVLSGGTTNVTATLGGKAATGSYSITSIGPPVLPTTAAPTPPARNAADVISMYSNAYTNVPIGTWNTGWQFSTAQTNFIKIGTNDVIRYRTLNFVGIEFTNPTINASGMSFFHMDIWTPDATTLPNVFRIKIVDFGANNVFGGGDDKEGEISVQRPQLVSNNWVSLEIPMSAFVTAGLTTRGNLAQMILSGTVPNVFVDNVYFWTPPTTPTVAAPTPTRPQANVLSVYSDAYTNIAGTDFNPNWGQSGFGTASQVAIAGNNTRAYPNFNYQGIQLGSNQDLTSYQYLHLDYYTANATTLNVFLISPGPQEKPFSLTVPTAGGWNSVDIPLSEFTPTVALNNVIQFKFDGGNGSQTIYLDNIYFWRIPPVPPVAAPTPTYPAADVISIYSNAYTNVGGTDFNPNWGQSGFGTATEVSIGGNNARFYPNFNYQGIQIGSNQNLTGYQFLHVDYYSANASTLNIFLICPPGSPGGQSPWEKSFSLTVPTAAGWNSIDIPLSHFTPIVALNNVFQFKFDGGTGSQSFYLDNILFRK